MAYCCHMSWPKPPVPCSTRRRTLATSFAPVGRSWRPASGSPTSTRSIWRTVALTVVAAVPLARFAMRTEADETVHRILGVMRRIQSGSVNDYTSYLVVGFLVAAGSLVLG